MKTVSRVSAVIFQNYGYWRSTWSNRTSYFRGFFTTGQRPSGSIRRMSAHSETTTEKLKSIFTTAGWLALAVASYGVLYGGLYACSEWLAPEPFATAAECHRALTELQYSEGHHGEYCAELERGGWCALAYDSRSGTDRCFMP
jgi:hypothetical protein